MKIFITNAISDTAYNILNYKAIMLFSFSLTPVISWLKESLAIEFLGFSLGILGFLTLLIVFDFITGIKAATYNNEVITSRKGLRSVDKLMSYFMFICFTALMQTLLQNEGYLWSIWLISNFKILVFAAIFLWEFHSIGENLYKRYGSKPRIFTMLDIITKILEKKVIEKIQGSELTTPIDEQIEERIENIEEIDPDQLDQMENNNI